MNKYERILLEAKTRIKNKRRKFIITILVVFMILLSIIIGGKVFSDLKNVNKEDHIIFFGYDKSAELFRRIL